MTTLYVIPTPGQVYKFNDDETSLYLIVEHRESDTAYLRMVSLTGNAAYRLGGPENWRSCDWFSKHMTLVYEDLAELLPKKHKPEYEYKGNTYKALGNVKIKHPENRKWVPGTLYESTTKALYAREEEDFKDKFKYIYRD